MNRHIIKDLIRAKDTNKWEQMENGKVFLPAAHIAIGGVFGNSLNGDPWQYSNNVMANEGLDHILDVAFSGATAETTHFIGIFVANYAPDGTETGATIASDSTETSDYVATDRVAWTEAGVSTRVITNSAAKADFVMNAGHTVYGAFLVGGIVTVADTKEGTGGTLKAASAFGASRSVIDTDTLSVTYTLTIADA